MSSTPGWMGVLKQKLHYQRQYTTSTGWLIGYAKYFNEWVNGMRTCNVIEPLVSRLQLKRRLMRKIMIVLNRKKVKKLKLLQIMKKTRRKSAIDTKRMTASKVS